MGLPFLFTGRKFMQTRPVNLLYKAARLTIYFSKPYPRNEDPGLNENFKSLILKPYKVLIRIFSSATKG